MRDSLSPVALSRLTWSADDRRAWKDAYRAAIRIGAVRSSYVGRYRGAIDDCQDPTCPDYGSRLIDGICRAARYSVHVDCMQGEGS